jgi:O-antigen ligase
MEARSIPLPRPVVPIGIWVLVAISVGLIAVTSLAADVPLSAFLAVGAVLALGFVAIAYRDLATGFALFTFLTFYDTAGATLVPSLTFSKLAGMVLALVWLFRIMTPGNRGPLVFRDRPALGAVTLLLAGWVLLSTLWVPTFTTGLGEAFRLFQGLILIFVVFTAVSRPRDIRLMTVAFIAGAMLTAVLGLTSSPTANGGRISGGFDDPNEFAAVIVPGMMLCGFAFFAFRGRPVRWAFAISIPILGLALLRSDSQGGIVALAVGAVAAVVFGGPARRVIAPVVCALLTVGFVDYTFLRPSGALTEGGTSREQLWHVALQVAHDHPFFGVGAGGFPQVEPSYAISSLSITRVDLIAKSYVVHNTYLNVLTDYGLIGLVLFFALGLYALSLGVRAAWGFSQSGDRQLELLSRGVVVAVVSMVTAYTFISAQYEKQLWILTGFCAALSSVTIAGRRRWAGAGTGRGNGRSP